MLKKPVPKSPFEARKIFNPVSNFKMSFSPDKYWIVGLVVALIIFVLITYNTSSYFKNMVNDTFANVKSMLPMSSPKFDVNVIKDLGLIFINDPSKQECKDMVNMLKNEGTFSSYEIIDVSIPEQRDFAEKVGALERGVPNFISKKLGVGFVGKKDSSKELVETLLAVKNNIEAQQQASSETKPENGDNLQSTNDLKNNLQQLNIIMFKMDGCGHCTRVVDELDRLQLRDFIEVVEISTPLAQQYLTEFNLPANGGVPFFYCRTNGKMLRGSRPVAKLVEEMLA